MLRLVLLHSSLPGLPLFSFFPALGPGFSHFPFFFSISAAFSSRIESPVGLFVGSPQLPYKAKHCLERVDIFYAKPTFIADATIVVYTIQISPFRQTNTRQLLRCSLPLNCFRQKKLLVSFERLWFHAVVPSKRTLTFYYTVTEILMKDYVYILRYILSVRSLELVINVLLIVSLI